MNKNILHYSLFGTAGGQEVDHTFAKFKVCQIWQIIIVAVSPSKNCLFN